ncbi:hemin uptake protein HemP [Rhizobium sp. RCAM05350]|nr:hemin uptake protein HemP [Rhizobium sp. RCAM05350]
MTRLKEGASPVFGRHDQDRKPVIPNEPDAVPVVLPAGQTQRIVESHELFRGGNEILIAHEGAIYRMKITRQGKLILNK